MRMLLLKPKVDERKITWKCVDLEGDDSTYYKDMIKFVECDMLAHRLVHTNSNVSFDLWLDDCGQVCYPPKAPVLPLINNRTKKPYYTMVGTILVSHSNEEGCCVALTDEDVKEFLEYVDFCWKNAVGAKMEIVAEP